MLALALLHVGALAAFTPCDEVPTKRASTSIGAPSNGRVDGAWRFEDTTEARVLPARHKARCLSWGTKRLVQSIARAGKAVSRAHDPEGAKGDAVVQLGVGNIGRAQGGPIRDFSRSHQAGRDADLAFYFVDATGAPLEVDDLVRVGDDLAALDPAPADARAHGARLDVARTWTLVRAPRGHGDRGALAVRVERHQGRAPRGGRAHEGRRQDREAGARDLASAFGCAAPRRPSPLAHPLHRRRVARRLSGRLMRSWVQPC